MAHRPQSSRWLSGSHRDPMCNLFSYVSMWFRDSQPDHC